MSNNASPQHDACQFRIINWIGIINQLVTAQGSKLLVNVDLPISQFIMLNHFGHRPERRSHQNRVPNDRRQKNAQQGGLDHERSTSDNVRGLVKTDLDNLFTVLDKLKRYLDDDR